MLRTDYIWFSLKSSFSKSASRKKTIRISVSGTFTFTTSRGSNAMDVYQTVPEFTSERDAGAEVVVNSCISKTDRIGMSD